MRDDPWFHALLERQRRPAGLYTTLAIARWRLAISRAVGQAPPGAVLKTDAWNEALGRATDLIAHIARGRRIVLMDLSPGILSNASGYTSRVLGDIRAIPLETRSVSVLLDISTSDHCPIGDIDAIAGNYARVLGRGGILLLIHNSASSVAARLSRWTGAASPAYSGFPPAYYFPPAQVVGAIERHGFTILDRRFTNTLAWLGRALDHLRPLPPSVTTVVASMELDWRVPGGARLGRQHVIFARLM